MLLTGASGGIGSAIAHALHARGAHLRLTARRGDVLDALAEELGGRVEVLSADLADASEVAALPSRAGAVDVLVANAALPATGRLESFDPAQIDRALDVNLRAPIQLARALVPAMVERGAGHLVFISSLSGKVASPGSALYAATKFGLRGFALGVRQDLHGTGVGVTVVVPGFIRGAGLFADTGLKLPPGVGTRSPEEVAEAVVDGIERDRAEVEVAPLGLRAGALVGAVAPTLSAVVQRGLGGRELASEFARAQGAKR